MNPSSFDPSPAVALLNAYRKVGILSHNLQDNLQNPELISAALEELEVTLEELCQSQQETTQIQQHLSAERQFYLELFEFAPNAYLLTDHWGGISRANQAAVDMFRLRRDFLEQKNMVEFIPERDRNDFRVWLFELRDLEQTLEMELQFQPRDGDPFPASVSVASIRDFKGRCTGFRWLIRDLTQVMQKDILERQLAAERYMNSLKSRFIQTICHELRTPLQIIHGSSDLIQRRGELSQFPQTQRHVQKIDTAVQRLRAILDDIVLYAELGSRDFSFRPAPLDLNQVCQEVVDMLEPTANAAADPQAERSPRLVFLGDRTSITPSMDKRLICIVLENLLSNALKFSNPESKVMMSLSYGDDKALIQIEDMGRGIPPEDRPHLFEPFHRATNVDNIPGVGLGLAIAKRAVEAHQGEIAIRSWVDVGTMVAVSLPLGELHW